MDIVINDITFDVDLKGMVSVKDLKKQFKKEIAKKQTSLQRYKIDNPLVVMDGVEDVFAPFFRSDIGYIVKMENEEIQSLTAHYYYQN